MKKYVVLAYSPDNELSAGRLRDDLVAAGEFVWWDQDILPGKEWKAEVEAAVQQAYAVILCFSVETQARSSTGLYPEAQDVLAAIRTKGDERIAVVPVRISDCELPGYLIDARRRLDELTPVDLFPEESRLFSFIALIQALRAAPDHP